MKDKLPNGRELRPDARAPAQGMEIVHARDLDAPWISMVPVAARQKTLTITSASAPLAIAAEAPAGASRVMLQVDGEVRYRIDGDEAAIVAGRGFVCSYRQMLFFAGDNFEHVVLHPVSGSVVIELYYY